VPVWAYDLASGFWRTVGVEEGFPRTLEAPLETGYDVTVKRLPGLTLASIRDWLAPLGIVVGETPDRRLCGCLAAARGSAFIFVDGDDVADEQRYTLAHELAHFIRDVWQPRQRVERMLGKVGTEVCDGDRAATQDERIAATLEGLGLSVQVHLLPRDAAGRPSTAAIADHEECADVLAFELLAPVAHLAQAGALGWSDSELLHRLVSVYGLPPRDAARYVDRLRPRARRPDGWLQALQKSV
jgi:hypothetical protein